MQDGEELEDVKADETAEQIPPAPAFGSCCNELAEALASEGFESLFTIGQDSVLFLSVGEVDVEGDQRTFVDHPVFYCPFCGTSLQTRDEVMAKLEPRDEAALEKPAENGEC